LLRNKRGEAIRFVKRSADGDSTTGMFNYCFAILNRDKREEALSYFTRVGNIGNTDALYNYALSLSLSLSLSLEQGLDGRPDLAGVMEYYKSSAYEGNIDSMDFYAIACTEG
jgi:hypothetical protein